MDNYSPNNGIAQELGVHLVALVMMQHGVHNQLLHRILLWIVRPNKISQCTRMKIVRIWYDDPISLGISVQLLTTITHTQDGQNH